MEFEQFVHSYNSYIRVAHQSRDRRRLEPASRLAIGPRVWQRSIDIRIGFIGRPHWPAAKPPASSRVCINLPVTHTNTHSSMYWPNTPLHGMVTLGYAHIRIITMSGMTSHSHYHPRSTNSHDDVPSLTITSSHDDCPPPICVNEVWGCTPSPLSHLPRAPHTACRWTGPTLSPSCHSYQWPATRRG